MVYTDFIIIFKEFFHRIRLITAFVQKYILT